MMKEQDWRGGQQLVIGKVRDYFYYMAELVFTRQVYPHNKYLNPSRDKLGSLFNKRNRTRPKHTRTLSLDYNMLPNSCCCSPQGESVRQLKEVLTGHSALLKEIKQSLTLQKVKGAPTFSPGHLELLQQKNRQLESQLRSKDNRIDSLRERYEELLMKFDNLTVHSKQASINTSFDSNTNNTNKSLYVSRKSDVVKQLKRLKDRLKAINFQQVFTKINQMGLQHRTP